MSKTIGFSVDDWVWATYLADIKGNRSAYITHLIVIGSAALANTPESLNPQIMKAEQVINDLQAEVARLKFENGNLRDKLNRKKKEPTPEEIEKAIGDFKFRSVKGMMSSWARGVDKHDL